VIVLDWLMPGVSGIDVCRHLRAGAGHPHVGVVLLTSLSQTDQIVEGLDAGADDYVPKPYADEELRARVASVVRAKDLLGRAERAEATVRALLEGAPDGLLTVDGGGLVAYANDAALRLFGTAPDELLGHPVPDRFRDVVDRAPPPGKAGVDVVLDDRIYSVTSSVLTGGHVSGVTYALRDVTERRRAAARRLDFYSIIAHDLRGPLTGIQLRTELIRRRHGTVLPPDVLDDIRRIEINCRSLVAMVNDFLDLARLEGTSYRLEREGFDLVELVDALLEEFRPLFELHQLEARRVIGGPARVFADRSRLAQVLSNLIHNAIKFTPAGGAFSVEVAPADGAVEVGVRDTGRGIAPEALPGLFHRYTRAIDTEHQVAGTGLGLMIVRELVEAHGGQVGVESTPGAGSRFWFRLPTVA
jgi:two-component system phosphate regulon sensor histidine kinase PhoR